MLSDATDIESGNPAANIDNKMDRLRCNKGEEQDRGGLTEEKEISIP
jgi:hypothetical protein